MRTRLVRPGFWTDARMADLPDATRLTYVGLWCLADDAGYLRWNHREIAAELYRFRSVKVRERQVQSQLKRLVDDERVQVLNCQRHAIIPSLPDHRIKGGEQLVTVQKEHERRCTTEDYVGNGRTTSDSVSVSVSGSSSDSVSGSFAGAPAGAKGYGSKDPVERRRELEAERDNPATPPWKLAAIKAQLALMDSGRVN